mgnify:CR=1 FL=1
MEIKKGNEKYHELDNITKLVENKDSLFDVKGKAVLDGCGYGF